MYVYIYMNTIYINLSDIVPQCKISFVPVYPRRVQGDIESLSSMPVCTHTCHYSWLSSKS